VRNANGWPHRIHTAHITNNLGDLYMIATETSNGGFSIVIPMFFASQDIKSNQWPEIRAGLLAVIRDAYDDAIKEVEQKHRISQK
jgi:hypothetical protein